MTLVDGRPQAVGKLIQSSQNIAAKVLKNLNDGDLVPTLESTVKEISLMISAKQNVKVNHF